MSDHSFTDAVTGREVVLTIPPRAVVFPMLPGELKIGVVHPGCPEVADLALQVDAFYCRTCSRSGRISGAWAMHMIETADNVSEG